MIVKSSENPPMAIPNSRWFRRTMEVKEEKGKVAKVSTSPSKNAGLYEKEKVPEGLKMEKCRKVRKLNDNKKNAN